MADRDYDQDLVIPQRQLWSQRSLILGESPKKQSGSITQGKESVAEPAMPYMEKPFLEYRRKSSSHSDFISSKEREDNVGSEKAGCHQNIIFLPICPNTHRPFWSPALSIFNLSQFKKEGNYSVAGKFEMAKKILKMSR